MENCLPNIMFTAAPEINGWSVTGPAEFLQPAATRKPLRFFWGRANLLADLKLASQNCDNISILCLLEPVLQHLIRDFNNNPGLHPSRCLRVLLFSLGLNHLTAILQKVLRIRYNYLKVIIHLSLLIIRDFTLEGESRLLLRFSPELVYLNLNVSLDSAQYNKNQIHSNMKLLSMEDTVHVFSFCPSLVNLINKLSIKNYKDLTLPSIEVMSISDQDHHHHSE